MPINFTILNLTSFPTYFPVNKKIVEKNPRLASKPETYLGCGPFKLVKWEHNHKMEFEKNENYLDSADVRIRKALALSIDRKSIVKKITTPALAFVPSGIIQNGKDFRKEGGNYFKDNDIETAKKLLEEAGYKDGKNFPQITVLYNTSESHKMIAEAVQEMWRKNLGINVNLRNQEWKVYLNTLQKLDYQIAPIYFYIDLFLCKEKVKNVIRSPLGFVDFKYAYVEE